jgi:hypothetical protein
MALMWKRMRDSIITIEGFSAVTMAKIPTHAENIQLTTLLTDLSSFESVSKMLQSGGTDVISLSGARSLFDGLISEHGDTYPLSALQPNSYLITNPHFENGVIKIQDGKESSLSRNEKLAVARYLKDGAVDDEDEDDDAETEGFASRVLKAAHKDKRQRTDNSKYSSTAHVYPQSNLCERLFSQAKLVMRDHRRSMHPETLNDILFLKANRKLWNATFLQEVWNAHGQGANDEDDTDSDDEEDDEA